MSPSSYFDLVAATWQSANMRQNLMTLLTRKRSDSYRVENGLLKKRSLWDKVRTFFRLSTRKVESKQVRAIIDDITRALPSPAIDKIGAGEIQDFFFHRLAALPLSMYSRHLAPSMYNYLKSKLGSKTPSVLSRPFDAEADDIRLSAALGCYESFGEGNSGSYLIKSANPAKRNAKGGSSKTLCIFKPSKEETFAPDNPYWSQTIKQWFYSIPPFSFFLKGNAFKTLAGQSYVAEEAASLISNNLSAGIREFFTRYPNQIKDKDIKGVLIRAAENFVPDTRAITLSMGRHRGSQKLPGSAQLWLHPKKGEKIAPATQVLDVDQHYISQHAADKTGLLKDEYLDMIAILDILTRNQDRHADNIMFSYSGEGAKQRITALHAIDNGSAWGTKLPKSRHFLELRNRYRWKNLESTNREMTLLGQFLIGYLSDPIHYQPMRNSIEALYKKEGLDGPGLEERLRRMDESRVLLQATVHESVSKPGRKHTTLRQMANCRTQQNMRSLLNQYRPKQSKESSSPSHKPVYFTHRP